MTSVEQILGLKCMYKERQPLDKCRECTGYRCYAKEIQCENYLAYHNGKQDNNPLRMKMCMKTQDIVDKIRRASDGGAI